MSAWHDELRVAADYLDERGFNQAAQALRREVAVPLKLLASLGDGVTLEIVCEGKTFWQADNALHSHVQFAHPIILPSHVIHRLSVWIEAEKLPNNDS